MYIFSCSVGLLTVVLLFSVVRGVELLFFISFARAKYSSPFSIRSSLESLGI